MLLHEVLHDIACGMIHVLCFSVLPIMWDTLNMLQKFTRVNSCAGFQVRDNMERIWRTNKTHQETANIIGHQMHQASSESSYPAISATRLFWLWIFWYLPSLWPSKIALHGQCMASAWPSSFHRSFCHSQGKASKNVADSGYIFEGAKTMKTTHIGVAGILLGRRKT